MLRILFATDHIHFPQGGGGGERNTHELSVALGERGFHPAVLSSFKADGSWLSWRNRLRRLLPPRPEFVRDMSNGYPVYRGWNMQRAADVVDLFRPDVVVVQSVHPEPLLAAFASRKVPLCVYLHEVVAIDHLRKLAREVPLVLSNSDFAAQRLLERCGLETEVVLPLVDPRYYATKTHPGRVLFVNTVPRKGLEIAFRLAESRPDIGFDFVRSWILTPEQGGEMQARARKAGNITLHPPTGDMRPLYATARLVLVPSQVEETWGRVATEAHINGIPVLGSDRGGLPQAIGPGGLTVPAEAPLEDWRAALARLWDDPESHAAFAAAARAYSRRREVQPDTIITRLQQILGRLISSAQSAREPDGVPA